MTHYRRDKIKQTTQILYVHSQYNYMMNNTLYGLKHTIFRCICLTKRQPMTLQHTLSEENRQKP